MTALITALLAWSGGPEDEQKLREEIRKLKQDLRLALDRLDDLERRVSALSPSKQEEKKKTEPPKQDPLEENSKWNELTVGKDAKFRLYGFLRLDAIFDDSRPNNTQVISSVRSEDPDAASAIRADDNDSSLTIHPRLTRLGLDFDGPRIEPLGGAKVDGKLEIDFYNLLPSGITSNSREFIRMRHAWFKLAWERFSLLAGQREDVISPIFPIVNSDLVMWGAGNLGDRRPQVRGEWSNGLFTATGMLGLTGSDDGQDLDTDNLLDGEDSALPTLQGRFAAAVDGWVEKQKIAGGVWGHWARERTNSAVGGENSWDSWALGADLTLPLLVNLWLKGEIWIGRNLDDVRGGIFQGVNRTTGEEIRSRGGWIELGWKPLEWYAVTAGLAADDPHKDDLNSGVTSDVSKDLNRIFYLANRFSFGPVEIGVDYLHWTTEYVDVGSGVDNRFNLFVAVKF